MTMFPGEAGEPLGWDYPPYPDEPGDYQDDFDEPDWLDEEGDP